MQKSTVLPEYKPRKETVIIKYKKSATVGFKIDCEAFLEEFEKLQSLNYADFAKVWQSMDFTYIFADQDYKVLLEVLCEICFEVAKKCMSTEKNIFIRLGAFYMLYGLYYKQPVRGMVKIRLTQGEYNEIKQLMAEMIKKNQLEPLYILVKMKTDGAFIFVAHNKQIRLDYSRDLKAFSYIEDTFQEKSSLSSLGQFKNIFKNDCVKNLQETCNKYEAELKRLSSKYPNIDQFKSTVLDTLQQSHQNIFNYSDTCEETPNSKEKQLEQRRLDIKMKAMKKNAEYRGSKSVMDRDS